MFSRNFNKFERRANENLVPLLYHCIHYLAIVMRFKCEYTVDNKIIFLIYNVRNIIMYNMKRTILISCNEIFSVNENI